MTAKFLHTTRIKKLLVRTMLVNGSDKVSACICHTIWSPVLDFYLSAVKFGFFLFLLAVERKLLVFLSILKYYLPDALKSINENF